MNRLNMKHVVAGILLSSAATCACISSFAEGSKDLYKSTTPGYRSYLLVSTTSGAFNPFPNYGVHKVYAKEGEVIYVGSSLVGLPYINGTGVTVDVGKAYIYKPNGDVAAFSSDSTIGRIVN